MSVDTAEPKQLNTRIDHSLYATVVAVAATEGLSLSKWVERAIRWDLEVNRREYAEELLRTVQGVAKIAFGEPHTADRPESNSCGNHQDRPD